jgi:hypothetical protein
MGSRAAGRLGLEALVWYLGTATVEARSAARTICPIRHVCSVLAPAGACASYVVHISCRDLNARLAGVPSAERRSFE